MIYPSVKDRLRSLKQYSSLKSLMILEALASSDSSYISIQDIAELTGLSNSTIHRVLQELCDSGYAKKNTSHFYKIGISALSLGLKINKSDYLIEAAESEMNKLNDLTGETVHLIVLDKFEGRYIAKKDAQNQIGLKSKVGWSLPLYCTAGGKALLAYQNSEWLDSYFKYNKLEKLTDKTITTEEEMMNELKTIRDRGYSLDDKEHHPDVTCIAAPIFDVEGKVACTISVAAPTYRFPLDKAISFASAIKKSAENISQIIREN